MVIGSVFYKYVAPPGLKLMIVYFYNYVAPLGLRLMHINSYNSIAMSPLWGLALLLFCFYKDVAPTEL